MEIQSVINDVKGKAESYAGQAQNVFKHGVDTVKAANDIVVKNVQKLAEAESATAKDLYSVTVESFNKARTDGVKAVTSNPEAYVPAGRDHIVSAYETGVTTFTKTRDELSKVFTKGFDHIQVELGVKPAPKKKAAPKKTTSAANGATKSATSTARKSTTAKRTTTARKTTTAAKKTA